MAVLMVAACESTDSTSTVGESGGEPEEVSSSQKAIVIDYSVSTASELGGGFLADKPDTGYVYMIVHYNIRNQGHSEFSTNPWYFYVIADGVKYDITFTVNLENTLKLVDLLDSGMISGNLAFEIPIGAKSVSVGYEFLFKDFNIVWTEG
jgi:hypothetical protein